MDELIREINWMMLQMLVGITCGQEQSCGIKASHEDEDDAEVAALRLNARGPNKLNGKSHQVGPYPCGWCLRWHVGRLMSRRQMWYLGAGVRHKKGEWGNEARDGQTDPDHGQGADVA